MAAIPLYQLDAFTDRPFGGNPAAVCPLSDWLPDGTLQSIAAENNLSETAFFVPEGEGFRLRWFTPKTEVDLCGHATLATGALILDHLDPGREHVTFETRSGLLSVQRDGERFAMDFPALPATEVPMPAGLADAIGVAPIAFLRAVKNMAVLENEAAVLAVMPDLAYIRTMEGSGLIVTARGEGCDCVSRYFAPHVGIDEDPVTGSAHCTIVPYWSARLGKPEIHARQVSERGGDLYCRNLGARVEIAGTVRLVIEGRFHL